jgi:hypothetical protein
MTRTLLCAAVASILLLLGIPACTGNDLPGGVCSTCADVYTNGGIPCGPGPAADAWHALANCGCEKGPCAVACAKSFCVSKPADEMCSTCLGDSCGPPTSACASN